MQFVTEYRQYIPCGTALFPNTNDSVYRRLFNAIARYINIKRAFSTYEQCKTLPYYYQTSGIHFSSMLPLYFNKWIVFFSDGGIGSKQLTE